MTYDRRDVDFFVVVCPGLSNIYYIPFDIGMQTEFVNLYPSRRKQVHQGVDFEVYKDRIDLLVSNMAKKRMDTSGVRKSPLPRKVCERDEESHTGPLQDWEKEVLTLLLNNGVPYQEISTLLRRQEDHLVYCQWALENRPPMGAFSLCRTPQAFSLPQVPTPCP